MRVGSIALRLALLFSTASTLVLVLMGLLIVQQVGRHFDELDLSTLNGKMLLLGRSLAKLRTPGDLERLDATLSDLLLGHEHLAVAMLDAGGRVLFVTPNVVFPPALLQAPAPGAAPVQGGTISWDGSAGSYRGIVAALATGIAGQAPLTVAVAIDIKPHHAFLGAFGRSLLWSVLGGIVLTALLSWIAARRGLAPVHEIARVAQRISARRLGERLPVDTVPRELVGLARAFNDMLARLEDSFQRLSDFSSDLAHELRTPISNIMTQTQVALATERTAEEYREVLYSNLEEHERLARMITDMLFLAKADHGLLVPSDEAVDLAAEVRALFAFYEAFVDERGVGLALAGHGTVHGDRLMIRRAVGNLLSNAIRHTERGGVVRVDVSPNAAGATELSVQNPGPAIAPEHLPRLFDRFYQVDPSRQHSREGAGLGLAITQSIVQAHRASIKVTSVDGATRFVIVFARPEPGVPAAAIASGVLPGTRGP